jgi:NhaP-type Na+/H+ or K+/H+ antiporter
MRTVLGILIGLVGGYLVGAVVGWLLVETLSGNTHDKSLEAAMTGAFVTGPLGAVIGAAAGFFARRR